MRSELQKSTTADLKGIGPHFSRDAITLLNLYMQWGITHTELRANLARLGLELEEWPNHLEVPEPPPLPPIPDVDDLELYPDIDDGGE